MKYKYQNGETPYSVTEIEGKNENFLVSVSNEGAVYIHYKDGLLRLYGGIDTPQHLIEASEWDDFKVDELVMVKDEGDSVWTKKHFRGVEDGRPAAWGNGKTSWSADEIEWITWDYCRRPTKEELNE